MRRHFIPILVVIGIAIAIAGSWRLYSLEHRDAKALTALNAASSSSRIKNVGTWCDAINQNRDYERTLYTLTTKQAAAELRLIAGALRGQRKGFTAQELVFLKLYLASVGALEKAVPKVLNLRPYTLKDLNCSSIVKSTVKSTKGGVK